METISIALLCTLIGCGVGFVGLKRNRDKDIRRDAKEEATIQVKLDMIYTKVEGIEKDIKEDKKDINEVKLIITKLDQSVRSAHKRIDSILKDKNLNEEGEI